MGTVSRFFSSLGGVALIAAAWGLFGLPIVETLAEPQYADFPGGAWGIVAMLLLMGSVPVTGGVLLLRRAFRGAPAGGSLAPSAQRSQPVAVARSTAQVSFEPVVRTQPPPASAGGAPSALARLVRTSSGRGLGAALVSVPLMIVWREAAPMIGPLALTVFSLVDPMMNLTRPSWWLSAVVSGTVWFVLFLVTAATADLVSNQPDVQTGFILPMMAFPAATALSALIRFLQRLGR